MRDMISQAARIHGNIGVLLIGFLLCACASQESRIDDARSTRLTVAEQAAVTAVSQLGVPYRYGGSTPAGFDCSGLVHYAYAQAGRSIPRTTKDQWRKLTPVAAANLRVGDLLFFHIGGKVSHVGLYLGSRRFVHAPSSGRDVTIEALDASFYRNAFVRGGRP